MVGAGGAASFDRIVADGGGCSGSGDHGSVSEVGDEGVADEDVVDELATAAVDAAVALLGRDAGGELSQPLLVALVRPGEAGGADLRAGWAVQIWVVAASGTSLRSRRTSGAASPLRSADSSVVATVRTVAASAARR